MAGIGVGYVSPMWWAQLCATFNGVFSQFLGFLIPFIILGFVAPAIADLGARAGKMLVATAALAYAATVMAGLISYFTGAWLFPDLLADSSATDSALLGEAVEIPAYFSIAIPPLMGVMTSLVLAFMLGVGCAAIGSGALKRGLSEFRDIVLYDKPHCDSSASVLYIRNLCEHDCGRTGNGHSLGFCQNNRCDFCDACRCASVAVLHRRMLQ